MQKAAVEVVQLFFPLPDVWKLKRLTQRQILEDSDTDNETF